MVQTETGLQEFQRMTQVIEDLWGIQCAVQQLYDQINSLAEMSLQNRWEINLLFMEQGSLCAALGEECFYANKSVIIRDTLSKAQERLDKRAQDHQNSQLICPLLHSSLANLFTYYFGWSPCNHYGLAHGQTLCH